jgi:hypothetical protein
MHNRLLGGSTDDENKNENAIFTTDLMPDGQIVVTRHNRD